MIHRSLMLAVAALSLAPAAHAQTAPGTLIALTPEQVEAAKEEGARRGAKTMLEGGPVRDRAIHGEVGVSIGTGGYSSIYGTAVAPIGDSGMIALSLANEQFGQSWQRRRVR